MKSLESFFKKPRTDQSDKKPDEIVPIPPARGATPKKPAAASTAAISSDTIKIDAAAASAERKRKADGAPEASESSGSAENAAGGIAPTKVASIFSKPPAIDPEEEQRISRSHLKQAKLREAEWKATVQSWRDVGQAIEPTWMEILSGELSKPYFKNLVAELEKRREKGDIIFPPIHQVFNALNYCPFDRVRVVIVGQDPYHGPGQAHGLSFSVCPGVPAPPSLRNIYKELSDDIPGFVTPNHGYLVSWSSQGVLLLNTGLTVESHKANSHQGLGWENFTDAIVTALNTRHRGLIFVLWGAHAQKKCAKVDRKRHVIIASAHPSPLSAHNGFFGKKIFSRINSALLEVGKPGIRWPLPTLAQMKAEEGDDDDEIMVKPAVDDVDCGGGGL